MKTSRPPSKLGAMDLGVDMSPYNGHTVGIMNLAAALPFLTVQAKTMADRDKSVECLLW